MIEHIITVGNIIEITLILGIAIFVYFIMKTKKSSIRHD